jgi:hypothetical protein
MKVQEYSERERESPYPRKRIKERWSMNRSPYTIHQKYPHTCTSWSRFMICFSFRSGLWLSKIWETSMTSNSPYLQLHKINLLSRVRKKDKIKSLGMEWNTLSYLRDHLRLKFLLKNFIKPPNWWLNKGKNKWHSKKTVLTLNRQRWGEAISPTGVCRKVRSRPTYSKSW